MKSALLFLTLALTSCSCSHLLKLIYDPKPPKVSLVQVEIGSISLSGFKLKPQLKLENPNDFELKGHDFHYRADALGSELASGEMVDQLVIPANGQVLISLPLTVSPETAFNVMGKVLSKKEKVDVTISGKAVFSSPVGDIPVDFTQVKTIPE